LEEAGYKYVFIDEVTLMDGFIEGAALFSDIFASSGMKIVLSGTDSLGFLFSQDEQLYDRCIMLHTTFISYREFENVLGIKGVDEYIRFGGTMSQSGENYNKNIFSSKKTTDEYVNTAIARNIQHSLKNYQNEGHFRGLYSLYEKNELTNAINRIVEDLNHRFTLDILTRKFKSHDFGSAKDLLLKDKENPSDSLYELNSEKITSDLMNLLEIKNKEELLVGIEDCHRTEIKEYLELLDLICEIDIVNMTNLNQKNTMIVFSQPGLRYSQAESLIKVLMNDELFKTFSLDERKHITEKILEDVKGRMLEEIVLLETKKANPELEVFKLQFAIGEFDMVIFDEDKGECQLFEIKHTNEPFENQYRHLTDQNKLAETQNRFG
ncbi:MAG: ATP-binding protein, partial [Fibrobacteraceae bacterium]|nr:ATP-binding protein [Fibrobacteraceae bacterium]